MNIEGLLNKLDEKISYHMERDIEAFPDIHKDAVLAGGKRLRAKTFFEFSKDTSESSMNMAAAVELLHAATLIHDDILDGSRLRRGRPALHRLYDIPTSLLYGDYLFSLAFSLIGELRDTRIYKELNNALREILKGEMLENYRRRDNDLTKKEYLSIIEKKSGVLFGLSCKLGAIVRGVSKDITRQAYLFGIGIGTAYQIMDDYFDYFSRNGDKERFKDIKEGFVTLPLIYLFDRCSNEERQVIVSALDGALGDKDLGRIVSFMERCNVPESIFEDIRTFLKSAEMSMPQYIAIDVGNDFNILSWVGDKLKHAQKEYCDSGRRFCRT